MNDITFAKTLASVMLDNKYDRFVKNRRTGKLDTKSLYKIDTSNKLFKRREARKNKHYAVSLVVDTSGSMSGDKIKTAAKSAERLSWHLSRMGIPHNVVSFNLVVEELKTYGTHFDRDIQDKLIGVTQSSDKYAVYGIWDCNKQIKSEDGRDIFPLFAHTKGYDEYRKKVALLNRMHGGVDYESMTGRRLVETSGGPGQNSDAEALIFARQKLLRQLGRKIMIFLSDGQPVPFNDDFESPNNPGHTQGEYDVKQEVKHTIDANIELYSIGIMSDAVNKYYPQKRTCSIKTLEQLYPHIIKLIKLNLRRG